MRKPARLERSGALTPRDRIWSAIRRFGKGHHFSIAEVMVLSGQRDDTILSYVRGLEKAGFLTGGGPDGTPPALRRRREFRRFALVRDVGVDTPRIDNEGRPVTQGMGREQMWRAIRILREFDFRELAAAASTEQHRVSPDEAQTYLRYLRLAGYVVVSRPARHGNHDPSAERLRFIASRNFGPRAPLVTARRELIDGNTGLVMYDARELNKPQVDVEAADSRLLVSGRGRSANAFSERAGRRVGAING